MALRTVLAVVLALALIACSLPALDSARTERTAGALDAATDRLRSTSDRLVMTSDPTTRGRPASASASATTASTTARSRRPTCW